MCTEDGGRTRITTSMSPSLARHIAKFLDLPDTQSVEHKLTLSRCHRYQVPNDPRSPRRSGHELRGQLWSQECVNEFRFLPRAVH